MKVTNVEIKATCSDPRRVKFHVDDVKGLGTFVEIEAIDHDGSKNTEELHARVVHYMSVLGITGDTLVTHSYSDMILSCA